MPYTELINFTAVLRTWSELNFVNDWSSGKSKSPLGQAFRTRKCRDRKSCGLSSTVVAKKVAKRSGLGAFDIREVKKGYVLASVIYWLSGTFFQHVDHQWFLKTRILQQLLWYLCGEWETLRTYYVGVDDFAFQVSISYYVSLHCFSGSSRKCSMSFAVSLWIALCT